MNKDKLETLKVVIGTIAYLIASGWLGYLDNLNGLGV
jgi:hypothetical protein